jgi:hypothetical protein
MIDETKIPEKLSPEILQEYFWVTLLEDMVMKIESKKIKNYSKDFVDESFLRFRLEIIPARIVKYFTDRFDAKLIALIRSR